jgi:hypothetical protein
VEPAGAEAEVVVEERLRLTDGDMKLVYVHWISGPDGTADRREITFAVEKK